MIKKHNSARNILISSMSSKGPCYWTRFDRKLEEEMFVIYFCVKGQASLELHNSITSINAKKADGINMVLLVRNYWNQLSLLWSDDKRDHLMQCGATILDRRVWQFCLCYEFTINRHMPMLSQNRFDFAVVFFELGDVLCDGGPD